MVLSRDVSIDSSCLSARRDTHGAINAWLHRRIECPGSRRHCAEQAASWTSGTYQYDGSGNIIAIGTDTFKYDTVGRLTSATVSGVSQTYAYDAFGNIISLTAGAGQCVNGNDCGRTVPIDSPTNRTSPTTEYDARGNRTLMDGHAATYDEANMMTSLQTLGGPRQYIYTADDERIATYGGGTWSWTIRDNGGAVLRELTSFDSSSSIASSGWTWTNDYVYRGASLLANEQAGVRRHFHLDHLGSFRLLTDDGSRQLGVHEFLPFGAEMEVGFRESPESSRKFTGHERDGGNDADGLDYMHARYYSSSVGRFLSVDSVLGTPERPQSWSRYSYALNSPVKNNDPDGRCTIDNETHGWLWCAAHTLGLTQTQHERVAIARNFFAQNDVVVNRQHIDASKLNDKQVMDAFDSFNAPWRNAGPAAQQVMTSAVTIPTIALSTLQTIDSTGTAPTGYKGGRQFQNDGRSGGQTLPKADANGNPISYREWDVKPSQAGINRGAERIVTGSDGSAWYTNDHYQTFTKIR